MAMPAAVKVQKKESIIAKGPLDRYFKVQKKESIIARGPLARYFVFTGRREKTSGGIKKDGIEKNKRGRYVSKKQAAHGHKMFQNIRPWVAAFLDARGQLNCQGFVAIGGRTLEGRALYLRMKNLYATVVGGAVPKKEEVVKTENEAA